MVIQRAPHGIMMQARRLMKAKRMKNFSTPLLAEVGFHRPAAGL